MTTDRREILFPEDGEHRTVVIVTSKGVYIGYQYFYDGEWIDDEDSGASLSIEEFNVVAAELKQFEEQERHLTRRTRAWKACAKRWRGDAKAASDGEDAATVITEQLDERIRELEAELERYKVAELVRLSEGK